MVLEAVQFDDQASVWPEHVDVETLGDNVDGRTRQPSGTAEIEKSTFELGARLGNRPAVLSQQGAQRLQTVPSPAAGTQLLDGPQVEYP